MSSATNPASARRGLGRGLEVLIGGAPATELAQLPLDHVHPNPRQPRRRFEHEATAALAESVRAQGLVQPIVVRSRAAGGYELIAGERRWRAAREAGLETIPRAYALLLDEFDLGLGEIAERVGRSKPSVSNRMRLLDLPEDVLAMLERGELTEGHARAVLAVPDHEDRRRLARDIVRRGLSVADYGNESSTRKGPRA